MRVFCSNVRGLVCNWDIIKKIDFSDFDIVAFNEVWAINDFENLKLNGFELKTKKLRTMNRGGGTVIFCKTELNCIEIETPFAEGIIESTGIKINSLIFLNIYRPPSGSKLDFTDKLISYLETLGSQKILIGGDFNLNSLTYNEWLESICNSINLEQKIKNITRMESGTSKYL